MKMKLVLVRLVAVQHFNIGAFHSDGKPVTCWAVAQAEDLGGEVMLLKLTTFSQVPGSNSVVQTSCPQFGTICRYINATCAIGVSLELSDQRLVM
jgi:hypothetical protein